MRFESRTWFILSLILFAGAIYFWERGNEYQARKAKSHPPVPQNTPTNPPRADHAAGASFSLLSPGARHSLLPASGSAAVTPNGPAASVTPAAADPAQSNGKSHRLSNTPQTAGELAHVETAVLLRNA